MIKEGSFVEIDYVGRVEGTNEIFDLTSEEVAKKEGIYNPKQKYGPVLVIIGANMIIPGVEEQLKNMKPGEEKEFVVEPKKAFGERNSKLVKVISLMEFKKEKIDPVPGMFITIDGLQAKVQSVSGGRVRVDFNHPLAGKH
ncbi:MAG: peptidylprolyl isomerase, partial [Candidatus Aenigmatarchaeota archaeon]